MNFLNTLGLAFGCVAIVCAGIATGYQLVAWLMGGGG